MISFAGLESSRMFSGPILSSPFKNFGSPDTNTKRFSRVSKCISPSAGTSAALLMAESLLGKGLGGVTKGNEPLNVARGKYPMTFDVADPCWPLYCIRGKYSRLDVGVGVTVDV